MRVLVTGNLGYIGPNLVAALQRAEHEVIGFDTGWFINSIALPPALPNVQHFGDIRDLSHDSHHTFERLLHGVDAVCHLAGLSNDPLSDLDPALTEEINLRASAAFADAAKAAGVRRFVFYSSCSVYGTANGEVDESSPARPLTAYARTKLGLEEHLIRLADESFQPVLFRNATVYGFGPALRLDLLVNGMTAWALTTGVVRLMSTGDALRPQLHIDDLTGLTVHVLGMDDRRFAAITAKPLNVGSTASNYSIRELAEIVASRVEGAQVRKDPDAWVDARSYRVNFDRLASAIPDFPIRRDVESSTPEIASRYARLGLDEDDVRSLRYTRIQQLKRARELGALDSELRTPRPSAATLDAE